MSDHGVKFVGMFYYCETKVAHDNSPLQLTHTFRSSSIFTISLAAAQSVKGYCEFVGLHAMLRNVGGALWRSVLSTRSAMPTRSMFIQTQSTPNAHAVMFLPGRHVLPSGAGTVNFPTIRTAAVSPLARKLFAVDGVQGVFFGADFVTITKAEGVEWAVLRPEIFEVIMEFFTDGTQPVISEGEVEFHSDTAIMDDDDEVVAMIKELLETRVKPAVAEDGGSILYRGFDPEDGIVNLELQGACSTCSSSSITLKSGVENMLRHYIPEVKGVREVVGAHSDAVQKASEKALSEMEKRLEEQGILRP